MRKIFFLRVVLLFCTYWVSAQQFISLWPVGKMPNTKGMAETDSIFNERYYRIGNPGMYAFFPSKQENKGTAVVICPGGGYHHYAYVGAMQVAKWFNTMGVSAFVLISRLPLSADLVDRSLVPLQDAQRAMKIIRNKATEWGIQTDKLGVMGFSAGGHVASSVGVHTDDVSSIGDTLDKIPFRPDFMLLVSPVISMGDYAHTGSRDNLLGPKPSKDLLEKYSNELQVTSQTPPAFMVCAENDPVVNPKNSLLFFTALRDKKVSERHRHRYEFNNIYLADFEEAGMRATGFNPDTNLVEVMEIADHPWYVGVQFHPEYSSTVLQPHPLFIAFIKAVIENSQKKSI